MSTTSPQAQALATEHPVVLAAAAAALGVLLGLGGLAMVSGPDVPPDPPAAAQQP